VRPLDVVVQHALGGVDMVALVASVLAHAVGGLHVHGHVAEAVRHAADGAEGLSAQLQALLGPVILNQVLPPKRLVKEVRRAPLTPEYKMALVYSLDVILMLLPSFEWLQVGTLRTLVVVVLLPVGL